MPFARVWEAVLHLIEGGISGWSLTHADEGAGQAMGEVSSPVTRQIHHVVVHIWLDAEGQTCLDVGCRNRASRGDLGASRRHVLAFLRSLDGRLGV